MKNYKKINLQNTTDDSESSISTNSSITDDQSSIGGYRMLAKKTNKNYNNQKGGAVKKTSKKSSKKTSKKSSKKSKKSKKSKQARSMLKRADEVESEEVDNIDSIDDDDDLDSDIEKDNKKDNKKDNQNKNNQKNDDVITSEQESENETLVSEGDDYSENPIDTEEQGIPSKYKKMIQKLKSQNKKLQKKVQNSKQSRSHQNKTDKESSSIIFSSSTEDSQEDGKKYKNQQNIFQQQGVNPYEQMAGPMQQMTGPMSPMPPMQMPQMPMQMPPMQMPMQMPIMNGLSHSGIEQETKLKNGSNTDMNGLLKNINNDQLIPIIPEMQGLFNTQQILQSQPQEFSSDVNILGTTEPKIMDPGLINNRNIPQSIIGNNSFNNPAPSIITNSVFNQSGGANFDSTKKKKKFFLIK